VGDALSSIGVIVAGALILFTGWFWVDAAASFLIGVVIITGSFRVLKETIHLLNEGAPEGAGIDEVSASIRAIEGVEGVHDAHVWALDPSYRLLSAHVVVTDRPLSQAAALMASIKTTLAKSFGIERTTIQFECADCGQCADAGDGGIA